ncbi:MAG: bifunctional UDP-sugar hydrolase/5'-nucleotidase, partial [Halobaculum sp.]
MVRFLHHSDIENVYDEPDRAARLAGLLRERDGPDSVVVGTGDDTSPGVLALVTRGRQALDFFDAAGTRLETFGNHDFDYGPDATRALVEDSDVTWVSANVRDEAGDPFGRSEGVVPWTVETVDGTRVGFVGVTDPATHSLNPMAAELAFDDPVAAATSAMGEAHEAGADRIVVLSHLGAGDDELARETDADLILGGHVHTRRVERVAGTLLTRPGVNGQAVVEATLDETGAEARVLDVADYDPEPVTALADWLRERRRETGLDRVVGHAERPLRRTEETIHGGESRIGNLVADAYRDAADADVAIQNAGGIRLGGPLVGEVTLADCIAVIPFEEPVVTVEVTGRELREAVRQMSGDAVDFGEDDWWHGHVSGMRVVYDEATDTVESVEVGGDPLDPDRMYRVATAEYLLHSDHEFPVI